MKKYLLSFFSVITCGVLVPIVAGAEIKWCSSTKQLGDFDWPNSNEYLFFPDYNTWECGTTDGGCKVDNTVYFSGKHYWGEKCNVEVDGPLEEGWELVQQLWGGGSWGDALSLYKNICTEITGKHAYKCKKPGNSAWWEEVSWGTSFDTCDKEYKPFVDDLCCSDLVERSGTKACTHKPCKCLQEKCGKQSIPSNKGICVEEGELVGTYYVKDNKWEATPENTLKLWSFCSGDKSDYKKLGAWNDNTDFYIKNKSENDIYISVTYDPSKWNDVNPTDDSYCLFCKDGYVYDANTDDCVSESGGSGSGDSGGGDSGGGGSEPSVEQEICGGVKCNSSMNGKFIFCAEHKDDTFVYKCESGYWNEVGVYGYCCDKNCSKPKKANFVLGGSWTPDSNHEMWFSTTARISEIAWSFNSTDVNNNCTVCKDGTRYNKNTEKCE